MQELNEENNSMEFKKENIVKSYLIKIGIIILIGIVLCIAWNSITTHNSYTKAMQLLDLEEYDLAENIFVELNNYKDSAEMVKETKYRKALKNKNEGKYEDAINGFNEVYGYSDSESMLDESRYLYANNLFENKKFSEALLAFEKISDYKDSETKIKEVKYQCANNCISEQKFKYAYSLLKQIYDYKDVSSILRKFTFRLKSETETHSDKRRTQTEYIYDKNNRLIEKTVTQINEKGKIEKVETSKSPEYNIKSPFDRVAQLEEASKYLIMNYNIIRLDDGRPKRIDFYGDEGNLICQEEYEYNEKNLPIHYSIESFSSGSKEAQTSISYNYDVCDNITSIETYVMGPEKMGKSTTTMSYDVFYNG